MKCVCDARGARSWIRRMVVALLASLGGVSAAHADGAAVRVLAAGSLRAAFEEIGQAFSAAENVPVDNGFGPSGVLRERIEKGEKADLFASADMGNPLTLSREGKAGPVVLFARNRLCALVRPGLTVAPGALLDAMLDPAKKLATSTPKADPAGDYTWAMFAKADRMRPGASAALASKALMGGLNSPVPPQGVDLFAWHLREGRADLFIAYCSAGPGFLADLPGASVVALPSALEVGADYGLTLLPTRSEPAARLALFILSHSGQAILAKHGFEAPLLSGGGQ
jgi:molybdate transport system substrate-binding protein